MSQKENIDQLIQIIHNQNAWYIGLLSVLIAIIAIFLTFYSFQQKRISDEQVKKFNVEIKKAWKINEDLKHSNESIIQYSLTAMARENYFATTDWDQRAELYLTSKQMFEVYYQNNKILENNLNMAKRATVFASEQKFSDLLINDYKESNHDGSSDFQSKAYNKVKKAYLMKASNDPIDYDFLDKFDYDYLKRIGHEIQNDDIQSKWFIELEKVNNFWTNETL